MPKPAFPTKENLVAAWIEYYTQPQESQARKESAWAFGMLYELTSTHPLVALDVILEILDQNNSASICSSLSAGPLENLLAEHGYEVIDRVEAESNIIRPDFKSLISGVWQNSMDNYIWDRVISIRGPSVNHTGA